MRRNKNNIFLRFDILSFTQYETYKKNNAIKQEEMILIWLSWVGPPIPEFIRM